MAGVRSTATSASSASSGSSAAEAAGSAAGGTGRRRRRFAPNQVLALGLAVALAALGAAGWTATGGMGWFARDPSRTLLGFGLNPLHNVLLLTAAAAGLILWHRPGGARGYGLLLAVGAAAVVVYGLVATGHGWDVLNVNRADTVLHLVLLVLGLAVALWPRPVRRRPRTGPRDVPPGSAEPSGG